MCQKDADLIRDWRGENRKVIAINNCFELAPWADIIYACDLRWWDRYHDRVKEKCSGELWGYHDGAVKKYGVNEWKPKNTGGNGGYQAVRLAIDHFWCDRVILVGFDMQGGHWHGQHGGGFPNPNPGNFKQWIGWLRRLGDEVDAEIINASRETAVDCFPRMSLEDALCLD